MLSKYYRFIPAIAVSAALSLGGPVRAENHAPPEFADMKARIGQLVEILQGSESCAAVETALDLTLGLVYGGTRPLPTRITEAGAQGADKDDLEIANRAERANVEIRETVGQVVSALHDLAMGGRCPELGGQATDVKFMLKEIEDVAFALSEFTAQCGIGDSLVEGRCAQLRPVLDELTGHIIVPGEGDGVPKRLVRGFALKLRSPFVPRWNRTWEEDVKLIPALAPGECGAVFKETKGLMLRLRLDGFTIVRDPWATQTLPRGTRIPIWTLEWVPSEYVKHFNLCNRDGTIEGSVTQRVKQDVPLNYFWRYYAKTPH